MLGGGSGAVLEGPGGSFSWRLGSVDRFSFGYGYRRAQDMLRGDTFLLAASASALGMTGARGLALEAEGEQAQGEAREQWCGVVMGRVVRGGGGFAEAGGEGALRFDEGVDGSRVKLRA